MQIQQTQAESHVLFGIFDVVRYVHAGTASLPKTIFCLHILEKNTIRQKILASPHSRNAILTNEHRNIRCYFVSWLQ